MNRKNSTVLLSVLVLLLLFLAYLRNSYYLHLNFSGEPMLDRMTKSGAMILGNENIVPATRSVKFWSVVQYWVFFLVVHTAVLWAAFNNSKVLRIHWLTYFALSAVSVFIFVLYQQFHALSGLYIYASFIKNFLLSPLYTAVAYIFVKYFAKIVT